MKSLFFLFLLVVSQYSVAIAQNYITISPGDCPNCLAAIELMDKSNNIYVLQEGYQIDSAAIRKEFSFLKTGKIIFSDSLFQQYSIDGLMAVSNPSGTLKCLLANYTKKANHYFNKLNSTEPCDTLTYSSYPIAKASIYKYLFTPDGKLYLLNTTGNNVIVFNLFEDKVLDTVSISEEMKQKAYYEFGMKDSNGYEFYRKLIAPKIQKSSLCTINDIAFYHDTLYLYISNDFVFFEGEKLEDTFLTHFQSIAVFNKGKYLTTFVPSNIIQKVKDSTQQFYAEEGSIYKNQNAFYVRLYNSMYYNTKNSKYLVGSFTPKNSKLDWIIRLEGAEGQTYSFTHPLFYKNYALVGNSSKLYDLDHRGKYLDLNYFQQSFDQSEWRKPKYCNLDFSVGSGIFTVLYNEVADNRPYYAKVDLKTNKIITNKFVPQLNPKLLRILSPYNSDYVLQFADNFKIVKYKIQ